MTRIESEQLKTVLSGARRVSDGAALLRQPLIDVDVTRDSIPELPTALASRNHSRPHFNPNAVTALQVLSVHKPATTAVPRVLLRRDNPCIVGTNQIHEGSAEQTTRSSRTEV